MKSEEQIRLYQRMVNVLHESAIYLKQDCSRLHGELALLGWILDGKPDPPGLHIVDRMEEDLAKAKSG